MLILCVYCYLDWKGFTMVRFYCDYCNSYLTHDATSVRKNHLSGRNHVKHVCDYYEEKAKEIGLWHEQEASIEITIDKLYRGIPGGSTTHGLNHTKLAHTKSLPPPPTLPSLPPPPPKVLHETRNDKELIGNILKTIE